MQALHPEQGLLATLAMQRDLPVDQADVATDVARVAQQQARGEPIHAGGVGDGLDADAGAGELDQVAAAPGGRVLILPAAADPRSSRSIRYAVRASAEASRRRPPEHRQSGDHRGHQRGGSAQTTARRRLAADLDATCRIGAGVGDRRFHQVQGAVVHGPLVEVIGDEAIEIERAHLDDAVGSRG